MTRGMVCAVFVFAAVALASPAAAQGKMCSEGKSANTAMWLSIAHPGLGEWYLKGFGPIEKAPPHKFWFGLIPGYGWPGYLQVISAQDAAQCKTNDAYE